MAAKAGFLLVSSQAFFLAHSELSERPLFITGEVSEIM
jgi:hypothetical protein